MVHGYNSSRDLVVLVEKIVAQTGCTCDIFLMSETKLAGCESERASDKTCLGTYWNQRHEISLYSCKSLIDGLFGHGVTLLHEIAHSKGIGDETQAEAWAIENARLFGLL